MKPMMNYETAARIRQDGYTDEELEYLLPRILRAARADGLLPLETLSTKKSVRRLQARFAEGVSKEKLAFLLSLEVGFRNESNRMGRCFR